MAARNSANLHAYDDAGVAAYYASLEYLTPCERWLFETYLKPGVAVLDLGVGGGRTTPYLSAIASNYVGVDYAEQMVQACRKKFPGLHFQVADAVDLSAFGDESFDAIVFAFNGIDYILPDEKRVRCLQECRRVLRRDGMFLFSSHNPRAILVRPAWNQGRVRSVAQDLVGEKSAWLSSLVALLTAGKALHATLRALGATTVRVVRRFSKAAFWRGEGCLVDPSHGGLTTHCASPDRVIKELEGAGFRLVTCRGDDFPQPSGKFVTDWYYYAFVKFSIGEECSA